MIKNIAKPFVKWVGGKTQLLNQIDNLIPSNIKLSNDTVYIEPFVGGGAVLFFILQKYTNVMKAYINDINKDLMDTYRVIKENPQQLICSLKNMEKEYNLLSVNNKKDYYLTQRERFNAKNDDYILNSALFIFLNKTCFNGLYRVNSQGNFNTPHGKYEKPLICNEDNIIICHKLLEKVEILQGDFENTLLYANEHTFYYLDPPYKPISVTSAFTSYSKENFDDEDQMRLNKFCNNITERGASFILSNSDLNTEENKNTFFDDLYSNYFIYRVKANRMINSNAKRRGKIFELMISNKEQTNHLYHGK